MVDTTTMEGSTMAEPKLLPDRLFTILGRELYCGILGKTARDAQQEYGSIARSKLGKGKVKWCGGVFLTEEGVGELEDGGELPLYSGVGFRVDCGLSAKDKVDAVLGLNRRVSWLLHANGIEAGWSGGLEDPLRIDSQTDMENSCYEPGSRVLQKWYRNMILEKNKEDGEEEAVTVLLIEFLQKCAEIGLDPWLLDLDIICDAYGMDREDHMTELFVRRLLGDMEEKCDG